MSDIYQQTVDATFVEIVAHFTDLHSLSLIIVHVHGGWDE